ncbi:MAG: threonine/serine exporter family protein [Alicyclobacillaceae bacterium]|nr:threonine/serine exporter family protein [Alicyclobacillaceae bacterium]
MGLLASFLSTISFAVLSGVPLRALIPAGATGTAAWLVWKAMSALGAGPVPATFLAALVAALIGEGLARWMKMPATLFQLSGIIPLVPGTTAFAAMQDFVAGDYQRGLADGTMTGFLAGAIAAGLVFSGTAVRILGRKGRDRQTV